MSLLHILALGLAACDTDRRKNKEKERLSKVKTRLVYISGGLEVYDAERHKNITIFSMNSRADEKVPEYWHFGRLYGGDSCSHARNLRYSKTKSDIQNLGFLPIYDLKLEKGFKGTILLAAMFPDSGLKLFKSDYPYGVFTYKNYAGNYPIVWRDEDLGQMIPVAVIDCETKDQLDMAIANLGPIRCFNEATT